MATLARFERAWSAYKPPLEGANPQLGDACKQTVPVSLGNVMAKLLAPVLLVPRVILPEAAALFLSTKVPDELPVLPTVSAPPELRLRFLLTIERSLVAPILQLEEACPEILTAPAELRASVPDVVVDKVRSPDALVTLSPGAPGPVMLLPEALTKLRSELIAVTPRLLRLVLAYEPEGA